MKVRAILAAAVVLAMATSAQAVQLVVMATNASDGIAGAKTYTIGVQFTSADVTAGGQNAVLFVQNLTVTGRRMGPIQQTRKLRAKPDVQSVQIELCIDSAAENNGGPPSTPLGTAGNNAFYRDTWWYNTSGGTLRASWTPTVTRHGDHRSRWRWQRRVHARQRRPVG